MSRLNKYLSLKPKEDKSVRKFADGEKVRLNYETMVSRDHYASLGKGYREFIESNRESVFTVRYDSGFVTFEENDAWLFAEEDLVKVGEERHDE